MKFRRMDVMKSKYKAQLREPPKMEAKSPKEKA